MEERRKSGKLKRLMYITRKNVKTISRKKLVRELDKLFKSTSLPFPKWKVWD